MKLHESPQRRLESTVRLLENALDRIEHLLAQDGQNGILAAVENTLSPDDRAFIVDKTRRLRTSLRSYAARFELKPHLRGIRQVLVGELSSAWVMLENCRPGRMKGYGVKFDDEVRAALEEEVEELLAQVITLRDRLREER